MALKFTFSSKEAKTCRFNEERLENLFVLLSGTNKVQASNSSMAMLDLPTNEELLGAICNHVPNGKTVSSVTDVNQLCILVWEVEDEVKCFFRYVKERLDNGRYFIEHLHRFPGI